MAITDLEMDGDGYYPTFRFYILIKIAQDSKEFGL
jgi:hypothetical protein